MALAGKEFEMKKTRRIIAFVLVLVFVFAFMAMSASASTNVARRATCSKCGGWDAVVISQSTVVVSSEHVSGCNSIHTGHDHVTRKITATIKCRECYRTYDEISYITTCE